MDAHRLEEEKADDPSSGSGTEHELQMSQGDDTQMTDSDHTQITEDDAIHLKFADSHVFTSTRGHMRSRRIVSDSDEDMGESSQQFDLDPDLVSPGQSSQKSGNRDQKWGGKQRPRFSPATSADNRGGSHARNVELGTAYDSDMAESLMFREPIEEAFQRRSHVHFDISDDADSESQAESPESQAKESQEAHDPQSPDTEAPDATEFRSRSRGISVSTGPASGEPGAETEDF